MTSGAAGITVYGLDAMVTMPPGSRRAMTTWTAIDRDYEALRTGMQTLFGDLGTSALPAA
jgi:hypothetical protein